MHELGIMFHVVKKVEAIVRENRLTEVEALVLQIGELSPVVPHYIRACYPAAVDGTIMQNTRLEIETLPANARCKSCGQVYNLIEQRKVCPSCGAEEFEILCGREFNIKEIRAR